MIAASIESDCGLSHRARRTAATDAAVDELARWRAAHAGLGIDLVRGNHDRAGAPPEGWADGWDNLAILDPPFCFAHYPAPSTDGYVLAGHLHPGISLKGAGAKGDMAPSLPIRLFQHPL